MDIGADTIRRWHVEDNGWSDIGYHFVVRRNGTIERGRDMETVGAHVAGHNKHSIGVCWVGGYQGIDNRTKEQKTSMATLIYLLKKMFPDADVLGHRDFHGVAKSCPSYNVKTELS